MTISGLNWTKASVHAKNQNNIETKTKSKKNEHRHLTGKRTCAQDQSNALLTLFFLRDGGDVVISSFYLPSVIYVFLCHVQIHSCTFAAYILSQKNSNYALQIPKKSLGTFYQSIDYLDYTSRSKIDTVHVIFPTMQICIAQLIQMHTLLSDCDFSACKLK